MADAMSNEELVTLGTCPPGLFLFDGILGFKSEYRTEDRHPDLPYKTDAYVVASGEYFWGGTGDVIARENLVVVPIDYDLAASRLSQPQGTEVEVLTKAIDALKQADGERLEKTNECREEAEMWKAQGDMYGWNFHQGRASGTIEASFAFHRAEKLIAAALATYGKVGG